MSVKGAERISSVELWTASCIFLSVSSMIVPVGAIAGHQSWISIIIGTIFAVVYAHVCAGLSEANSRKSIVEVGEVLMGKWGGKAMGLLYGWFSFHLTTFMMKDHWQFTVSVALPTTPVIIIATTIIVLVIWISYAGIEAIGRVSILFFPIIILYIMLSFVLLSKDFDFSHLQPIFQNNWRKVLYAGIQISILPLGKIVLLTQLFPHLNKRGRIKKVSSWGVVTAGLIILATNITNVLALGPLSPKLTYPAYTAYSYIQVADFLERAEILIYTLFVSVNFIQMGICFYAAAVCLAKVFGIDNYRVLLIPLGFLVVEQSLFLVKNQAEHIKIITYTWPWYAMVFNFIIPLLLLIITAVSKRKRSSA